MKKLLAILLALAMAFTFVACATTDAGDAGDDTQSTEPIKVGCIQDTSGGAAIAGQPNQWGAEYAVKVINENGGINGRQIELYCEDCQNDASIGVTCYRKLVDEIGVCAIIGPPLSNPASAWVELATEDEIPIVGHFMDEACTTNPDTGETYPYMFLCEPSSSVQMYILGEYAVSELKVKSIATLYNTSNAYAVSQEGPFVEFVKNSGGEVLLEETFTWNDTDYTSQAQKIAAANPDAVLLCDYCNQMVTAYDNLRDAGYEGYILGANTMYPPFNSLIKNKAYNCYFVQNYDYADTATGNISELCDLQMKDQGTNYPVSNVGFGWDAVQVLANAMRQANDPTDGVEVRDILESSTKDVQLAQTTITIDPATHRPTRAMGMYIATYDDNNTIQCVAHLTSDYNA
ncbi:MAG: ABC transporter substrate-binding protein [Oscillospiraceae bacterium]|nr:ABC transporter substrate-binding protein [Oscillospiraceae bacterium]